MYAGLLASEAGHYTIFTDLAREIAGADIMKPRIAELLLIESDIVRNLPNTPFIHG
jgi:tRNA isopentenyl-2-thiomethyl-A-37 hydroxylase MiaE